MVGNFEDAAMATVLNESIQSVVIYDGFARSSGRDALLLRDHLSATRSWTTKILQSKARASVPASPR